MTDVRFRQSQVMRFLWQFFLITALIVACHSTKPHTINQSRASGDRCVQSYNPNIDYFPAKINITHATGLAVEYHKNYKIVTVKKPWQNADKGFQSVLVQCGTPAPSGFKETQIITVPVKSVVALSTTHLPHFAKLGLVAQLIGVSDSKRVNTLEVLQKIKAGKISNVGSNANINIEKLLELNPDLVTTYGEGNSQADSYSKLLEAGLKVAINAEYMENTPLGRTEWLKFTALFFNREEVAEKIFGETARKYQEIVQKTKFLKKPPTVFVGFNFKGTWYTPGGNSYVAKYLADAGAIYLWKNDKSSGTLPLSFEAVVERATNANYWLNLSLSWKTLKDVLTEDNRYADFQAVKLGNIYNNNARVNLQGGNDYWEGGISNPDVVLSDLIKILHPEVLPNHQLVYYRKLV
jgi:iron complex transport system substrate-binding protein